MNITTSTQLAAEAARYGNHFFEPEALRFFRGRVHSHVYAGRYFITSEKHVNPYAGIDEPRRYTVRQFSIVPGVSFRIDDVSEFQEFATLAEAKSYVRGLA